MKWTSKRRVAEKCETNGTAYATVAPSVKRFYPKKCTTAKIALKLCSYLTQKFQKHLCVGCDNGERWFWREEDIHTMMMILRMCICDGCLRPCPRAKHHGNDQTTAHREREHQCR